MCCIGGYFMHTSIFIYGAVITILYFIPIKRKLYLYVAILGSAMLGIVFKQLNFMDFFNMYINWGGYQQQNVWILIYIGMIYGIQHLLVYY